MTPYALALPLLLLPVMAGVFALAARLLGADAGYLLGFGLYWLFWCLLVPHWLLEPISKLRTCANR
jgi:biotin transporter BioY